MEQGVFGRLMLPCGISAKPTADCCSIVSNPAPLSAHCCELHKHMWKAPVMPERVMPLHLDHRMP
jgi:hypothetical protein